LVGGAVGGGGAQAWVYAGLSKSDYFNNTKLG
jgi:hypothetical protein